MSYVSPTPPFFSFLNLIHAFLLTLPTFLPLLVSIHSLIAMNTHRSNLGRRLSAVEGDSSLPAPSHLSSSDGMKAIMFYNEGVNHQKSGDYIAAAEMYSRAASM